MAIEGGDALRLLIFLILVKYFVFNVKIIIVMIAGGIFHEGQLSRTKHEYYKIYFRV